MSQNINLYSPAFRKVRRRLTLASASALLLVVLLVLGTVHQYLAREVAGLDEEVRSAEALLTAQRGYLDRLQREAATRGKDPKLEEETARLEAELKPAREAMAALEGGVIGTRDGFSEYLGAFSRQSIAGLWLTGLTLGSGGEIEIRGRALRPELMPGYIQRLNAEKVLAGRTFDRLELAQPQAVQSSAGAAEARPPAGAAAGVAVPPRFLEFTLATATSPPAEKAR